jgi:hypothetical protein
MSGAAAAGAAAARAARLRKEEEELTPYNAEDLDGWEFKIVRSVTQGFKGVEAVRRLCEEESHAGWEMVEKFDDSRIRFKRRLEMRSRDQYLGPGAVDPYRTTAGMSEGRLVLVVLGVCAAVAAAAILIAKLVG